MPDELYDLTLREFWHKVDGFNELHQSKQRRMFEASRLTAAIVIASFAGKAMAPDEVFRFPWETPRELKIMTSERFNELTRKFRLNGKHNSIQTKS